MQILELIRQSESSIFNYDNSIIPIQISDLMTAIIDQTAFDIHDGQQLQMFNQLMQTSLQAMQDQDYLLLADILEYELKPFLELDK